MEGLNWQTLHLSLAGGLLQKVDDRARQPPYLDIAKDVQHAELGGLQTRHPFAALSNAIAGGGALTDCRRLAVNGDELLVWTKDALYSWSPVLAAWVRRGEHLAVATAEESRFATTDDQIEADRAELGGVIVYAWQVTGTDLDVYVAAISKETGAVVLSPTLVADAARPRLVAVSTRIMLFWTEASTGDLLCRPLDPADLATTLAAAAVTVHAATEYYYDVAPALDATDLGDCVVGAARLNPNTSFLAFHVTEAGAVIKSVEARTCDGPIAVAYDPGHLYFRVIRANGAAIQSDRFEVAGVAESGVNAAVGSTTAGQTNQIAAAFRTAEDSPNVYRCYAFWSTGENTGPTDWSSRVNYVDTEGAVGAESTFERRLGIASRAFDHDGRVFAWGVFAGQSSFSGANTQGFRAQLQNTYFLYRDDATIHAKAATFRAGGLTPSAGRLPGVQLVDGTTGYAWCGTERRIIALGAKQTGYGARAPRDIRFTFDSDSARRCARLGQTLYVAGGEVLQYDGEKLVEVGFHVFPWYFGAIEAAAATSLPVGTWALKLSWRWDNAKGETERSTTATVGTVEITVAGNKIQIPTWVPLYQTKKRGDVRPPAVEAWRTKVNPTEDFPFSLATDKDPTDATNPNRYIANDPSVASLPTFDDELVDADLGQNESHPENGAVLENLAPPPATIIAATDTRIFLAGVAGDPDRVWYSKQRRDGQIAAFHDALTVDVPPAGGAITGLAFLNETLVVFRETAIYLLPGNGFGNVGPADGSQNFGPPRAISTDVGAVGHEAIGVTDRGLIFKSRKGWYLLSRGFGVEYIGAPVSDYDDEAPLAVHVLEGEHQVRILTAARMLTWDTLADQWGEWTIADGLDAVLWQGSHVYLTATGPRQQQAAYAGVDYGLDVETAWIKPADLQGWARVRKLLVLGEYRSAHKLRYRIAYDYDPTYIDDDIWTPEPTVVGGPLQVEISPMRPVCEAIKLRLTAVDAVDTNNPPSGEALKLTGLSAELGFKRGVFRQLAAAQRT